MVVFGIETLSEPLSNAFSIKTLNKTLVFENKIDSIMRLGVSISSKYLNNYSSLDKNFTTLLVNIDVRVDYLTEVKELNYKTFNILDFVNICTSIYVCDENYTITSSAIDLDLLSIENDKINIYIVFISSIII